MRKTPYGNRLGFRLCYLRCQWGQYDQPHPCKPEILQGRLVLTDTESRNGTLIHRKQIPTNTHVALRPGSSFAIGQRDFVIALS